MQIWEVYTGKRAQKKTDSDLRSKVDAFEESCALAVGGKSEFILEDLRILQNIMNL